MENTTLDTYIRKMQDQETKGILLKLKNEMRKPDVTWEEIKTILTLLHDRDKDILLEITPLILK